MDENSAIETDQQQPQHHSNKLQFPKEAQLLAVILGKENLDQFRSGDNNDDSIKESKFWLGIDLELDAMMEKEMDKVYESIEKDQTKDNDLEKLEQEFEHQNLESKENDNLSKKNLMKIKQQLMDDETDFNRTEPNLLELLDLSD